MIVEHRKLIAMLIVLEDSLTLSTVRSVVIVDTVKVLVIGESQSVKATFVSSSLLWLDFASYYYYYYCNTAGRELKIYRYILSKSPFPVVLLAPLELFFPQKGPGPGR